MKQPYTIGRLEKTILASVGMVIFSYMFIVVIDDIRSRRDDGAKSQTKTVAPRTKLTVPDYRILDIHIADGVGEFVGLLRPTSGAREASSMLRVSSERGYEISVKSNTNLSLEELFTGFTVLGCHFTFRHRETQVIVRFAPLVDWLEDEPMDTTEFVQLSRSGIWDVDLGWTIADSEGGRISWHRPMQSVLVTD